MVVRCNVVLALHAIYRMGFCEASADTCAMIALILHNFGKVHNTTPRPLFIAVPPRPVHVLRLPVTDSVRCHPLPFIHP